MPILYMAVFIVHLVNSREGLGMLDVDGPVYASDHIAVVTDLTISISSRD
jgi:hypothetical protein